MIQLLRNYLSVRVSPLYFLLSAIWIFLYSVPLEVIRPVSFFDVLKIALVLFSLRLYDDVIQDKDDSLDALKLPLVLFLSLSALSWLQDGLDLSALWICFFVFNHIMYKALGHLDFWAFVIPAFQFPVILLAVTFPIWQGEMDKIRLLSAACLFFSALVFRWLEQSEDHRQPIWIYLFSSLVVAMIVFDFTSLLSFLAAIVALLCLLVLFLFCKRRMHLWWAIIVLLLQLAAFNFGF